MLETMVYISLSAVLITLTAQWFHVVLQSASKQKQRQRQHVSLKQLAWDFRDDVYESADIALENNGTQISLTSTGGEKTFYLVSDRLVRRWVGQQASPSRQQVYRNLGDLRIEFEPDGLPDRIAMNIYRPVMTPSLKPSPEPQSGFTFKEMPVLRISCGKSSVESKSPPSSGGD